jgi:hypothetical protein
MSSRGLLVWLGRQSFRSTTVIALVSTLLVMAGAAGLRKVVATRAATAAATALPNREMSRNLSASGIIAGTANGQKVVGVFDGTFDAKTQKITLLNSKSGTLQATFKAFGRSNATTPLPENSYTRTFVRSCANPSGTVPCQPTAPANTVSGEMQISNTGSLKFYNTRLVFTDFLDARGGIPTTANAYFNDGQVALNGKLGVSRDYGDIDPSSSQTRVWSFSFPSSSLQSFYFRYTIVADIGVATESVEPAAIQNDADRTITINGQGFNSPTVTLLNSSGATVATLSSTVVSASQLTATVPTGTATGIYSVQVTNSGGTAGGVGSSTLVGRLTVTGVPDGVHTGAITTFGDTGPYRINANTTISGTILPGTVIYVDNGVNLLVGAGLTANGGIPGVPATSPAQIVFTRSPGATIWGGLDATSPSTSELTLKNCVIEYGGSLGGAQVDISGSGRTLRFTDSISRRSGGYGLRATGNSDFFTGFTRSRIENNASVAILLSANAALGVGSTGAGMGDLDASNANTRVPDQSYYFSAANVIRGNGINAAENVIQIDAAANDFTRSGVLVGQGDIPIRIRGASGNPSTVGNSNGSPGAELSINPTALIQLDAGMDLKAGDGTLFGNIAANGYAGYSHSPNANTGISQRITFDKIPGGGNFGALFFSSTSAGSSILNFVSVRNGGTSPSGTAQVIIDNINYTFNFTNSESNNSSSYGLQYRGSTSVLRTNTTYSSNTTGTENVISTAATISTIAGGNFGDGNQANQAPLLNAALTAVDPGRGIYIAEEQRTGGWFIRFVNTTNATLKIAGIDVPANSIKLLTKGVNQVGAEQPNNWPMDSTDLLAIKNIALSPNKDILYFTSFGGGFRLVRGINVSPGQAKGTTPLNISNAAALVGGETVMPVTVGNVGTVYNDPDQPNNKFGLLENDIRGMAVNPVSGDIYIADLNREKVFRLTTGGTISDFAGVGRSANPPTFIWKPFPFPASGSSPDATAVLIYQPEAITVSDDGTTVYISDGLYGRVIRVKAGKAELVTQLGTFTSGVYDQSANPMPGGLALHGGKLYISNTNSHTIVGIDNPGNVSADVSPASGNGSTTTPAINLIAGTPGTTCSFTPSACGDGGTISGMGFDLRFMASNLMSDSNGLLIADQGREYRARIRYLNLSGSPATLANVTVPAGQGNTIAGSGLPDPYNGGLATSAILDSPVGVAVDNNGNAFIAESSDNSSGSALRFVNRGSTSITLLGQTVAPGNIIRVNRDANSISNDESTNPLNAYFYGLQGLKWTSEGLYIVDTNGKLVPTAQGLRTSKLRFLNLSNAAVTFYGSITVQPGEIKTIAGGSTDPSSIGDGEIATSAKLLGTTDVEVDPTTKDIYLSEAYVNNRRVRKILRSTGVISSLSLAANVNYTGLAFDNSGRLLIAASGTMSGQILRETGVGTGTFAVVTSSLAISRPRDIVVDSSDNLYVMNSGTQQILKLPIGGGTATNFAGTANSGGFAGDGGNPTSAQIDIDASDIDIDSTGGTVTNTMQTSNITISSTGEVIFADSKNNRIRRIR